MGNNNNLSKSKSKDDNFYACKENFVSNDLDKNFKRSFERKFTNPILLNNSKKNFEKLKEQYENKNNNKKNNKNNIYKDKIDGPSMIKKENSNINENIIPISKENDSNYDNESNSTEITETSKKISWTNLKNNIDLNIKKVFFIPHIDNKEYENTNVKLKVTNTLTSSNQNEQNEYELKFYRNELELRNSYIEKLVVKGIMRPNEKENQKSHNSLIIFDWDDTLLPTSFLTKNGIYNENLILSNSDQEKIKKLENTVFGILSKALDRGDVFIITNAGPGWVEYSAEKYYPKIMSLLKKIYIISARGEFESRFPNNARLWKIHAFLEIKKELEDIVTNIICLGDSLIEMDAGKILAEKFSEAFIKTIKFREFPKPEELNKQLTLVLEQFQIIYTTIKNVTIRVEKRKGKKDK